MPHRFFALAGLVAALCLYGCDDSTPKAATACNCQPAPPPAPAEHLTRLHYTRHHVRTAKRYWVRESRAQESVVQSYSYQSTSHSYEAQRDERGGMDESRSYQSSDAQNEAQGSARVFVDGYGRRHVEMASATVSVPPEAGERRDPWFAYDSKCDEKK